MIALFYANSIDKESRDDTREATCKSPQWIYVYAKEVDQCPREDTRKPSVKIKNMHTGMQWM